MTQPVLVGQALELWRGQLREAVERRDPAPLLAIASRQIEHGASALDLNVGASGDRLALVWAATTLREAYPDIELWLDCGDAATLAKVLPTIPSPVVANAAFLGARDAGTVIEAAAEAGAGLVLSPAHLDPTYDVIPATDLLVATTEAIEAIGTSFHLPNALRQRSYVDALAYPAASDPSRAQRSLELLRLLRDRSTSIDASIDGSLRGLVAVGNIGHSAPAKLRPTLRACYAAAATGAGADALILPVEEQRTFHAVAVATGAREPRDAVEGWLRDVATAAAEGAPLPGPGDSAQSLDPLAIEAWTLLASETG